MPETTTIAEAEDIVAERRPPERRPPDLDRALRDLAHVQRRPAFDALDVFANLAEAAERADARRDGLGAHATVIAILQGKPPPPPPPIPEALLVAALTDDFLPSNALAGRVGTSRGNGIPRRLQAISARYAARGELSPVETQMIDGRVHFRRRPVDP